MTCEPLNANTESLFPNWYDEIEIFADGCANAEMIVCNLQTLANAQASNAKNTCATSASAYYTYSTSGATVAVTAPTNAPASPANGDKHTETYTDGVDVVWARTAGAWVACAVDIAKIAVRQSQTQPLATDTVTLPIAGNYRVTRLLQLHKNNWQYSNQLSLSIPSGVITPISPVFSIQFNASYNGYISASFPANATGTRQLWFRINGGGWNIIAENPINSAINNTIINGTAITGLNSGDNAEFGIYQNSGTTMTINAVMQILEVYY